MRIDEHPDWPAVVEAFRLKAADFALFHAGESDVEMMSSLDVAKAKMLPACRETFGEEVAVKILQAFATFVADRKAEIDLAAPSHKGLQ